MQHMSNQEFVARYGSQVTMTIEDDTVIVRGSLYIRGDRQITSLPKLLSVAGSLTIHECPQLVTLSERLTVGHDMEIFVTPITRLPDSLVVGNNLWIVWCNSLDTISPGVVVHGELLVRGCDSLRSLSPGATIAKSIIISECNAFTDLPEGLQVNGRLAVIKSKVFAQLPADIVVHGGLFLEECPALKSLPASVNVKGMTLLPDHLQHSSNPIRYGRFNLKYMVLEDSCEVIPATIAYCQAHFPDVAVGLGIALDSSDEKTTYVSYVHDGNYLIFTDFAADGTISITHAVATAKLLRQVGVYKDYLKFFAA